jgi:hypothetical protein
LTRAFKRVVVTDALRRCLDNPQLPIAIVTASEPKTETAFDGALLNSQGMQISTFR